MLEQDFASGRFFEVDPYGVRSWVDVRSCHYDPTTAHWYAICVDGQVRWLQRPPSRPGPSGLPQRPGSPGSVRPGPYGPPDVRPAGRQLPPWAWPWWGPALAGGMFVVGAAGSAFNTGLEQNAVAGFGTGVSGMFLNALLLTPIALWVLQFILIIIGFGRGLAIIGPNMRVKPLLRASCVLNTILAIFMLLLSLDGSLSLASALGGLVGVAAAWHTSSAIIRWRGW